MITAIELISGVGPSVCHGTLPLLIEAAVVVETLLSTEQKDLPLILCNCRHQFLKARWMNDLPTLQTVTYLQWFILI